jgi:hypothetical protein
MNIYTNEQKEIANKIGDNYQATSWRDWKWQIRHSIKDIKTFEHLLGVTFTDDEINDVEKTLQKFPLSITPYYLSLIDKSEYATDPIFRQSFPSPSELVVSQCDHADPLHEEADSPAPGITHRYPDRVLSMSVMFARCIAATAHGNARWVMWIPFLIVRRSARAWNISVRRRSSVMFSFPGGIRSCFPMSILTGS